MSVHPTIAYCLVALAVTAASLTTARAQKLSFTLVEEFVIGDDGEAQAEYLFSYPELVRTDSKGNIYIRDEKRADVRVYDANGLFMTTIGKRGDGPGEMREIFGMHVDAKDRLIVADRMSRRFSIFTDLGSSFETRAFEESRTISPDQILSLEDALVLRYVKPTDGRKGGPGNWDDMVLHLHDSEMNWVEAFAPLGDIYDLEIPFLTAYSNTPGAVIAATNGTDMIVLAPDIYSGHLYRYKRLRNSWVMDKLEGMSADHRAYIPVSASDYDSSPDLRKTSIMVSNRTGTYFARALSWSRGVIILSTGEIVNFVSRTPLKGPSEKKAELFDQHGSLMGYGPLMFADSRLNDDGRIMGSIKILWKDPNDRVYIRRRNEQGFYVLSVANLLISPL